MVIGIIAMLAGVLLPAINATMKRAAITRTRGDMKVAVSAWKGYYAEYGWWPVGRSPADTGNNLFGMPGAESNSSGGILMNARVMEKILYPRTEAEWGGADNDIRAYNPQHIQFMTFDTRAIDASGAFVDAWGNTNRMLFDLNDNGRVDRYGHPPVYDNVIVWSVGPDGLDGPQSSPLSKDNVNSWD